MEAEHGQGLEDTMSVNNAAHPGRRSRSHRCVEAVQAVFRTNSELSSAGRADLTAVAGQH